MDDEAIKQKVQCCACNGSLKSSKHINFILLDKEATWNPNWGNVISGEKERAVAIVCDDCICRYSSASFMKTIIPLKAVEWNEDFTEIKYHEV